MRAASEDFCPEAVCFTELHRSCTAIDFANSPKKKAFRNSLLRKALQCRGDKI